MEPLKGMKCHRCGGAMVYERFYSEDDRFEGWRCIICGEIVDQVILENRRWVRTGVMNLSLLDHNNLTPN